MQALPKREREGTREGQLTGPTRQQRCPTLPISYNYKRLVYGPVGVLVPCTLSASRENVTELSRQRGGKWTPSMPYWLSRKGTATRPRRHRAIAYSPGNWTPLYALEGSGPPFSRRRRGLIGGFFPDPISQDGIVCLERAQRRAPCAPMRHNVVPGRAVRHIRYKWHVCLKRQPSLHS